VRAQGPLSGAVEDADSENNEAVDEEDDSDASTVLYQPQTEELSEDESAKVEALLFGND
jgi:hypothetical protein